MKYMILTYASQRDYDGMAGQATDTPPWTPEDFAAMGAFMTAFNTELAQSGRLVETRALAAPVHTRRVQLRDGIAVATDGPYAEAEEVLAGYWVIECDSFAEATELAGRLADCPAPEHVRAAARADVRPVVEGDDDLVM